MTEILVAEASLDLLTDKPGKAMRLRYDAPAPDSDLGWVNRSIPSGNGDMGVNVFGGIEKERIQTTENSLYDREPDRGLKGRGLTNSAEAFIDSDHQNIGNCQREQYLNERRDPAARPDTAATSMRAADYALLFICF